MPSCYTCNRTFRSPRALQDHCEAKKHPNSEAEGHWDSETKDHLTKGHWYCAPCRRLFISQKSLHQHLGHSPAHWGTDKSESKSNESAESPRYCGSCRIWVANKESLYHHLANNPKHNWCSICSRDFSSRAALNQHRQSKVHAIKHTFGCPLCIRSFKRPSSIAHHIESGCHKITRHQVTAAVHALKVIPTISISRQLQGPENPAPSIISYSATELAFNGIAYGCYLCHRTFKKLASLNSHLNSAAHDSYQFKCPKCKGKFTLISALIQHIESECCGIARFQQVMNEADLLTKKFTKLLLK